MSWPSSYFMRTFGQAYLSSHGLSLDWDSWRAALLNLVFASGMVGALFGVACWSARGARATAIRIALFAWPVAFYVWMSDPAPVPQLFVDAFFPSSMVLAVLAGSVFVLPVVYRRGVDESAAAVLFTLIFAAALESRVLLQMTSVGYPIYYNGPAVLAYPMLISVVLRGAPAANKKASLGLVLACVTCFDAAGVPVLVRALSWPQTEVLDTTHGTIRPVASVARSYRAAIAFIAEKAARHESVLVVPEDTSLYFLSDTRPPTRVYAFDPGVLAPGHMTTELFSEIEKSDVRFLLWSDRRFPEYGVPEFGRDFNQELAEFLTSRFAQVGPLIQADATGLNFTVWQRKAH